MIKRFFKNPLSVIGFTIIVGFIFVFIMAPVLAPPEDCDTPIAMWIPNQILEAVGTDIDCDMYEMPRSGFRATPSAPSVENPLGTTP